MRKILLLFIVFLFALPSFASNLIDWNSFCEKEYQKVCPNSFNPNFSYENNIYEILCIPYLSSLVRGKQPLFIKLVSEHENINNGMFDEYNWKISQDELVKYI